MREFVTDYVKTCNVCLRNKPRHHQPYGFLNQLPIPLRPWDSISMDFIEQLPESNGYTDILVIVDRLTKQAIFVPTSRTLDSPGLASLFISHVFSKHGVPSHVTSDRGAEFISRFSKSLAQALHMKLHFTSGYHPEADGQTERVNQTLEQYLRMYCNYQQTNWAHLLPLAEFAYNNAPSATTGVSPFFANKGYHPHLQVHPIQDLPSVDAQQFAQNLASAHSELKESIRDAQKHYQLPADARRSPPPSFQVGDQVFMLAKYLRTTQPSCKLAERFLGPFTITGKPSTQSYQIRLPDYLRSVHPVFHVSQLEPSQIILPPLLC